MRKFIVGSMLAVFVAGGSAIAADLPYRAPVYKAPPPPPVFSWTGCYIGGHVGWMKNDSELTGYPTGSNALLAPFATYSYEANNSDVTAGVQYGCNYQTGKWVFGLDSSFSWSGLDETVSAAHPTTGGVNPYTETITQDVKYFTTTRGRIGYAWDRWMIFAAGGLATGRVESSYLAQFPAGFFSGSETKTRYGWTVGGGVELALSQNWFLRGEYMYVDLGNFGYSNAQTPVLLISTWATEVDTKFHVARVALSYRFTTAPSLLHWATSGFRY